MSIWKSLSEQSKPKWAELYEKLTGKKWEIPTKEPDKCETILEDVSEIDKLMKEKPGYSVDVQGREG